MEKHEEQLKDLEDAIASNDPAAIQGAVVPVLLATLGDLRRIAVAMERQADAQEFIAAVLREDAAKG